MTLTRDEIERDRAAGTSGPWESVASIPEEGFECYWIKCVAEYGPITRGFRVTEIATVNGPQWREQEANARRIARLPELEAHYFATDATETKLRARIAELEAALIWCSGSPDFNDGGQAREGWLKLCRPLIAGSKQK